MNKVINSIKQCIWLVKSRPFPPVFYPVFPITAYLLATYSQHKSLIIFLSISLMTYLSILGTNIYNDLVDEEIDMVNKKETGLTTKKAAHTTVFYFSAFCFITALIIAFLINYATLIVMAIGVIAGIAYSHPKLKLDHVFIVKTLLTSMGPMLSSLVGLTAAATYPPKGILVVCIAFLGGLILGPVGDTIDRKGDKQGGKKTLPAVIGVPATLKVQYCLATIVFVIGLVGLHIFPPYPSWYGYLIFFMTISYIFYKLGQVSICYDDKVIMKTIRIKLFLALYVVLQLSFLFWDLW